MGLLLLLLRVLIYCGFGWAVEVFFNASRTALVKRPTNWELAGTSHIWAGLSYAVGGLLFEAVHSTVADKPLALRLFVYLFGLYVVEYSAGFILKKTVGRCPWEYQGRFAIHGFIQLTYIPWWLLFVFVFERLVNGLQVALPVFLRAAGVPIG